MYILTKFDGWYDSTHILSEEQLREWVRDGSLDRPYMGKDWRVFSITEEIPIEIIREKYEK